MKISYTVEVGEKFEPPVNGLAPSNYDPAVHEARLITAVDERDAHPDWLRGCTYVLRKKKVLKTFFVSNSKVGVRTTLASLDQAWKQSWPSWPSGQTEFVEERVYEGDTLIDIIIHKRKAEENEQRST